MKNWLILNFIKLFTYMIISLVSIGSTPFVFPSEIGGIQRHHRFSLDFGTVTARRFPVGEAQTGRGVIRRDLPIGKDLRVEQFGVRGFGQIQQIAAPFPGEVRRRHRQRVEIGPGGQFHAVAPIRIERHVFGADEVAVKEQIVPVVPGLEKLGAYSVKDECVVHFRRFVLMRYQIVVKRPRRAEVETAAVGQQKQFFPPGAAGFPHPIQHGGIVVELPLEVETVELIRDVLHRFRRADLHIDRGSQFQRGEIGAQKPGDQRRRGRHCRKTPCGADEVHRIPEALEETPGERLPSVAVAVHQQTEFDARF